MRDIEFRGYVADEEQFVYGYLMPGDCIFQTYEPKKGRCGIGIFSVVPESIGQYTGCRDINGIKIYENDIVKEVYGSRYYQVVYDKHSFTLDPVFVDMHFYQTWINPKRLEVIGNSYTKGEKNDERKKTDNIFKRVCRCISHILR